MRRKCAEFRIQTRVNEISFRFVDLNNGDPYIEINTRDGCVRVSFFEACTEKRGDIEEMVGDIRQLASQIDVYNEKHNPRKEKK